MRGKGKIELFWWDAPGSCSSARQEQCWEPQKGMLKTVQVLRFYFLSSSCLSEFWL